MKILSIDPGTSCGWATGEKGTMPIFGTWNLKPDRWADLGSRTLYLGRFLEQALPGVQLVVFEEVRHHLGVDAAHVYGAIIAQVQAKCRELGGIPYEAVPVGTIKKHWTGKGNANKDEMMAHARRRGFDIQNDDEADALAILDWALSREGKQ